MLKECKNFREEGRRLKTEKHPQLKNHRGQTRMTKVKAITGTLLLAGTFGFSPRTSALDNAGEGWWCEPSTGYWNGTKWVVQGGACYYDPSLPGVPGNNTLPGPSAPPTSPPGGGGVPPSDPRGPDLELSPKLKCVMSEYLHADVKNKMHSGRTMKQKDRWAFQQVVNGVAQPGTRRYETSNKAPAGATWRPVGGSADHGYAWGYLYNAAFEPSRVDRKGIHSVYGDLSAPGELTAFGTSIFVIGHETAHLVISNASEQTADWYGIYALRQYINDNGSKCPQ